MSSSGVSCAVRLAFDAAYYDLDQASGATGRVALSAMRKKLAADVSREQFDELARALCDAGRYELFDAPTDDVPPEVRAGAVQGQYGAWCYVGRMEDDLPEVPYAYDPPEADGSPDDGTFVSRFNSAFEILADVRGSDLLPLALLRLFLNIAPADFQAGIAAVLASGDYVLADLSQPDPLAQAGAVTDPTGRSWSYVARLAS